MLVHAVLRLVFEKLGLKGGWRSRYWGCLEYWVGYMKGCLVGLALAVWERRIKYCGIEFGYVFGGRKKCVVARWGWKG